jgi:hypothetical protein
MQTIPLAASAIAGWVPLGNLNPPGHTFPTDHQYIYLNGFSSTAGSGEIPLLSPGNVIVTSVKITRYSSGSPAADYAITFFACKEVRGEFGHVRSLSPSLAAKVGAIDQFCNSYSPNPGLTVEQCYSKSIEVNIANGDAMGTAAGLDLSLFDNRVPSISYVSPSRWTATPDGFDHFHVVPFTDYLAEPAYSTARALLGQFDGKIKRTIEPVGGTLATEVAGTAQSAWFAAGQPTYPESPHLAILPDNVDPTRVGVSIGTSQPGFPSQSYTFTPSSNGTVNRAPSQITPGPTLYCWELGFFGNAPVGAVIVQLTDANTLKMDGRYGATSCASIQPWALSANTFTYTR